MTTAELWTIRDVAKAYQVCEATARQMAKDGRIPRPIVLGTRTHRWNAGDVMAALQGHQAAEGEGCRDAS